MSCIDLIISTKLRTSLSCEHKSYKPKFKGTAFQVLHLVFSESNFHFFTFFIFVSHPLPLFLIPVNLFSISSQIWVLVHSIKSMVNLTLYFISGLSFLDRIVLSSLYFKNHILTQFCFTYCKVCIPCLLCYKQTHSLQITEFINHPRKLTPRLFLE